MKAFEIYDMCLSENCDINLTITPKVNFFKGNLATEDFDLLVIDPRANTRYQMVGIIESYGKTDDWACIRPYDGFPPIFCPKAIVKELYENLLYNLTIFKF